MNSTALGATGKQESGIIFVNDAHEKFYYEKLEDAISGRVSYGALLLSWYQR